MKRKSENTEPLSIYYMSNVFVRMTLAMWKWLISINSIVFFATQRTQQHTRTYYTIHISFRRTRCVFVCSFSALFVDRTIKCKLFAYMTVKSPILGRNIRRKLRCVVSRKNSESMTFFNRILYLTRTDMPVQRNKS